MLKFKKIELLTLISAVPADSELLLVHDQGIYIMSASQPVGQRTTIYAEGCNPDKDTNWWDTARRFIGGDDFGEPFAKAGDILKNLQHAITGLQIRVTPTQIITDVY